MIWLLCLEPPVGVPMEAEPAQGPSYPFLELLCFSGGQAEEQSFLFPAFLAKARTRVNIGYKFVDLRPLMYVFHST